MSDMSSPASGIAACTISLELNGQQRQVDVYPWTTLLDLLREQLHLTGTKKGCDHGQCGSCTVLLDDRRVNACLVLAVQVRGRPVTTVEGLGEPGALHPVQEQFLECDAYQCGYCTPGQICSAVGVLDEVGRGWPSHVTTDLNTKPLLSSEELRERMSGNICRCGAYSNIIDAINDVAGSRA